jgi:PLU-1-like protein
LREIVGELNQIHVNVGPPASKIAKILAQAETWYSSHVGLLRRCRLLTEGSEFQTELEQQVEPAELEVALQDAESNVSLQLEEALKLRKLLEKANNWRQQVSLIAPKRSKRSGKSARSRLTLEDLISLIAESTDIPIDTDDDVHRLQIQLSTVEAWRSQVSTQLEGIIDGFQKLQSRVRNVYGEAEDFGLEFYAKPSSTFGNPASDPCSSDHGNDALESDCDEDDVLLSTSGSDAEVIRQIKDLQEGAKEICVTTAEGELGDLLENVADWCVRSFKYLNDPKEIFDKRYFGAFDRFLSEGRVLLQKSGTGDIQLNGNGISSRVGIAWGVLVSGQLQRLDTLQKEREAFKEWCRVANSVLADAKSLSAGRLCDLANGSRRFPAGKWRTVQALFKVILDFSLNFRP